MTARDPLMKPRKPKGALGVLLLAFALIAALGLVLEFTSGARGAWIGAQPGGRFVIGIAAAAFAVIAAHAARLILARRKKSEEHGGRDAGDHA